MTNYITIDSNGITYRQEEKGGFFYNWKFPAVAHSFTVPPEVKVPCIINAYFKHWRDIEIEGLEIW